MSSPTPARLHLLACFAFLSALSAPSAVNSADWIHWRGPEQNGFSKEKNLPDSFDPAEAGKNNLVWKQPVGGRSAPLVLDGRLYIVQGVGEGSEEAERLTCLDAETGGKLWEHKVNVFHTDIVSS